MITQKYFLYDFGPLKLRPLDGDFAPQDTFAIRLFFEKPLTVGKEPKLLLDLPSTLQIRARRFCRAQAADLLTDYERREGYFYGAKDEEERLILEAVIQLEQPYDRPTREMQIGMALLPGEETAAEIFLVYDRVHFRFFKDGEMINENFPVGKPARANGRAEVASAMTYTYDIESISREEKEREVDVDIRYYAPAGCNSWAGDAINFYHDGVYHLIYLFDRHHHGSRFGGGAHYFAQLTTTDFVNWTDHGALFELEEDWQTVGTGTMFFWNGRYYYGFGFHTSRMIPWEHTCSGELENRWQKTGMATPMTYAEMRSAGKYPAGTNFAVSEDGIRFRLMGLVGHWTENPSIYADEKGGLRMITGYPGNGIWEAKDVFSPWTRVIEGFPPEGERSAMQNTSECPSAFTWNGYRYMLMGCTGYWRTEKDGEEYFDSAAQGYDIYDGLAVPMVSPIGDDRMLIAGWIQGIGWGSVLIQRELIQYPDGRLGMKWMPELSPCKGELLTSHMDGPFETDPHDSYYYELEIVPDAAGSFTLQFGEECELKLDFAAELAQIGKVGGENLPPAHVVADKANGVRVPWQMEDTHFKCHNFSLAHVDVMKEPFSLRVVQYWSEKMECLLLDVEIAGQRTMISCRPHASVKKTVPVCHGKTALTAGRVYRYVRAK